MKLFNSLLNKKGVNTLIPKGSFGDLDTLAANLQLDPDALRAFEQAYGAYQLQEQDVFTMAVNDIPTTCDETLERRILDELLALSNVIEINDDGHHICKIDVPKLTDHVTVTNAEIQALPVDARPMCTGTLMSIDISEPSSHALLWYLHRFQSENDKQAYHLFRQGLDILDLDSITYQIIDRNPNSMSNWLPEIAQANSVDTPFRIPNTKILKVPLTVLQLTRKGFETLTPATKSLINAYCMEVFGLDVNQQYFIKTGTHASKFEFRNACIREPQEVREMGEYFLFNHSSALSMAGPLTQPCIYGMATTTEWVVRDFIQDTENNPTIYQGLPLHTEYRVFVDFDTQSVIGISPYWEPSVMEKRFKEQRDPHDIHDYVSYKNHKDTLMNRYHENKQKVIENVQTLLKAHPSLHGQWSIDIMQNGDDFWLIDMAIAENSAFYDCVPKELRNPSTEDWLPILTKTE